MRRFRLILLLLSIALFISAGCVRRPTTSADSGNPSGSSSESRQSAPVYSTQASDGGNVLVELTPLNLAGSEKDSLHFQVAMNTHSVELDYDLAQLSVLRTDNGYEVQASRWDGERGGHHVKGTLYFPPVNLHGAAWVEVVIRDVAGVPERILRWELSVALPDAEQLSEMTALRSELGAEREQLVEAPVTSDQVSDLYKSFVCPCCGKDIGSCDCAMAAERRRVVDALVVVEASQSQVYQAMYKTYGAGAFFDQAVADQAEADLLAQLPAERPVLVVEPTQADLGTVLISNGLVSATYTVRNAGQSDLIITGLQTTCGCTTAVLQTSEGISPVFGANAAENPADWSVVLEAGEEASLVATFDTLFHGPDATGGFQRAVSIISNDPLNARQDVSFVLEVSK